MYPDRTGRSANTGLGISTMARRAFMRILAMALLALCANAAGARAAEQVDVYLFWAIGCPHCEREIAFLRRVEAEEPRVRVHYLEVSRDAANRRAFKAVAERLALEELAVPLTLVGDAPMAGYATDETSGAELRRRIAYCVASGCPDTVAPTLRSLAAGHGQAEAPRVNTQAPDARAAPRAIPPTILIPLLGEVRTSDLSLPVLTLVLGALDGFNPCAMWVLVYLISLLMNLNDKRRLALIVGTFVFSSGVLYFLFMTAWLNAFLFLGYVRAVTIIIGLIALGGGILSIREFLETKGAMVCKVTGVDDKKKLSARMKELVAAPLTWMTFAGIVFLAFTINSIEFVCSSAIPAVFTQVLALSGLSPLEHYGYIALYDLFFMLDDLLVFGSALLIMSNTGEKYARYCKIIGGAVMLLLGMMLLFAPNLLA